MTLFYSTPSCYIKAVQDANVTLPTKEDDFFPYASDNHSYWTGYFTSRPTLKYFERRGNNILQVWHKVPFWVLFYFYKISTYLLVWLSFDKFSNLPSREQTLPYKLTGWINLIRKLVRWARWQTTYWISPVSSCQMIFGKACSSIWKERVFDNIL